MGFFDGWREAGAKEPHKPPIKQPEPIKSVKQPQLPLADPDEIAEHKKVIVMVQERAESRTKAFEALAALVKKHLGSKLDSEINQLRKDMR